MAIARLSTGEVFGSYSDINEVTAPVQVGRFSLPESTKEKIGELTMPLTQEGGDYILSMLDPNAETLMKHEGFSFDYRRVGCYVPPSTRGGSCSFTMVNEGQAEAATAEMTEKDLVAYLTPHNVQVHDWHFTFSGAIVKGIRMEGDLQAVVYVTPGEWIRLAPSVLNWPVFAFGAPVIGVSYYDRVPNAEGGFDMDLHPDHPILESMKF